MAAKKKATKGGKAGATAFAAGRAARDNVYVRRLVEDDEIRESLRAAFDSARKVYERMSNGKRPSKVLFDDRKTQKELREAVVSLREAADGLRGTRRRKRRRGRKLLGLVIVGGALALILSEDLRKKCLDALFGAEEEFEYTSTTVPPSEPAESEPVSAS